MKPVSPVIPGENFTETIIAEHQDEYQNLPAIKVEPGMLITRWELTFRDRLRLLFGGSVYLWIMTFGQPLQPLLMQTERPPLVKHQ